MGHNYSGDVEKMRAITSRGAYIEFDALAWGPNSMSPETVGKLTDSIVSLINGGLTDRILLAQDICTQPQLKKNGGGGYAYIQNHVVPALKARGVSDAVIHRITVENPTRVLTFVAPQARKV
jgi:phosphotriesterase-related protein